MPTRSFGVEFFFAFEQLLVVLELFVELVELFESFVLEFVLFEQLVLEFVELFESFVLEFVLFEQHSGQG